MTQASTKGGFIAAFWALLLLLQGCQSVPHNAPQADTLLNVPFFAQTEYQCGPAALASMLSWAGTPTSPESLVNEVWLPGRHGSLATELMAAARARELLVYPLESFDDIQTELDAGHPVLMQQNLLFNWWPKWHFAVIVGHGEDGTVYFQHSAEQNAQAVPAHWLKARWKPGAVAFVALPSGQIPATATPAQLARRIADVSHSSSSDALAFWKAGSTLFENNAMLQFGYANALNRRGDLSLAGKHYIAAVAAEPTLAAGWNNLADTLIQLGCPDAARQAVSQALLLKPHNDVFLQTRDELPNSTTGNQCSTWTQRINALVNN